MRTNISAGLNGFVLLRMLKKAIMQASVTAHGACKVPLQDTVKAQLILNEQERERDPIVFGRQRINHSSVWLQASMA